LQKVNILDHFLFEWVELLNSGKVTSLQLVEACLGRIQKHDNKIKSFTKVFNDDALNNSILSDERRKKGKPLSIIDGIPFASKENIEVKNKVAAAGMLSRKDTISSINSKVIDLLNEAGAINLGHLNMHEAALGSTNDNPLHGKTFNPHKEGFTPGGSSGGSAAAVACGFSLFSLGTDTLGSIRIPAAYCGVSGIKPSKGLVSLNGIVPLSSSFDTLGPLARNVKDLSLVLDLLIRFDPDCSESVNLDIKRDYVFSKKEFVIGYFEDLSILNIETEIIEKYNMCIKLFHDLGFYTRSFSSNNIDFAKARRSGFNIIESEAYHEHQLDLEINPELLSKGLKKFLEYGKNLSATKLTQSKSYINDIKVKFNHFFDKCDVILLPTTPQKPFVFGQRDDTQADLTCISNLIESPSISVPVGYSKDRLPIGMQFIGRKYEDFKILKISEELERNLNQNMKIRNFL